MHSALHDGRKSSLLAKRKKMYTSFLAGVFCFALMLISGSFQSYQDASMVSTLLMPTSVVVSCTQDSQCAPFGSKRRPYQCVNNQCTSRPLFPLHSIDLTGTLCTLFCIMISSGGGLGGGGLLVPLYIIVLGFTSHDAIPLSKATIFGSAIASCLLNVRQKHPLVPGRQLIDYEVMVMMEPMTLAGTIIGVSMNKVCPEWIITVLLVLLLGQTSRRMVVKGMSVWRKEAAKDEELQRKVLSQWQDVMNSAKYTQAVVACAHKWRRYRKHHTVVTVPGPYRHSSSSSESVAEPEHEEHVDALSSLLPSHQRDSSMEKAKQLEELQMFKRVVPWSDVSVLVVAWLGLLSYSILKGGHGAPSIIGLVCGSAAYWGLTVLAFPFFVSVTSFFSYKLLHRHQLLQSCGHKYTTGDILWDRRTTVTYPAICTVAGIAAGLLGIGGGMVKGPLLLEIGLHPQVASATSSAMILFTSSATTFQFMIFGMLPYDYALWFGAVGLVGGLIGQLGLSYLIRKYRKTAFVLFVIAGVIGTSGTIMGILGVQDIIQHGLQGFRSLCCNL